MALYVLVTLVTVALAYMVVPYERITTYRTTKEQLIRRVSLIAIFTILFLLSALRMEVGNDYKNYAITCHEIWVNGHVVTEAGFNLLVKGIYRLFGGENYIAVFAFFAFSTLYIFLKVFRQYSASFFLSFFMFMTLGIYFRTFNTVRYYFVLGIALYALMFLIKGQHVLFISLILAAAFFHKSVLFVIPAYYMAFFIKRKYQYVILGVCSLLLLVCKELVMWLALKLYPSYQNTEYIENTGNMIQQLPGIAQCLVVAILAIFMYKKLIQERKEYRIYFNLNLMALLLLICGYYIPLLSRFSYYLIITHLLFVPGIIMAVKDRKMKYSLMLILVFICMIYFALFLRGAESPGIRVLPYQTWILEGMKEYNYANEVL